MDTDKTVNIDKYKAPLVRIFNFPRKSSLCSILNFLWRTLKFEPHQASVVAFSAKNAIIRFDSQNLADEAVQWCDQKYCHGRMVRVYEATEEDVTKVNRESISDGMPSTKPGRAIKEAIEKHGAAYAEPESPDSGVDLILASGENSDDEYFDNMELRIPAFANEYFLRGVPPDNVDFARCPRPTNVANIVGLPSSSSDIQTIETAPQKRPAPPTGILTGQSRKKFPRLLQKEVRPRLPVRNNPNQPGQPFFVRPQPVVARDMAAASLPKKINVKVVPTSRQCLFIWADGPRADNQELIVEWVIQHQLGVDVGKERESIQLGRRNRVLLHIGATKASIKYTYTLQGFDNAHRQIAFGNGEFRPTFSSEELELLYKKALSYAADTMYPFEVLHRCKPKSYFDDIYNQQDGKRMMFPYLKDENGHPSCPINGDMDGLFFSTLRKGSQLPDKSPFGDVQMVVEAGKLLDFERMNMYFADFYCNEATGQVGRSSLMHYVTIVVCDKDSAADERCKLKKLIPLDPKENIFLRCQYDPTTNKQQYLAQFKENQMGHKQDLLVEIYLTKAVSLFEAREFHQVGIIGKGSSRQFGLPNNKLCEKCNIYQIKQCSLCPTRFRYAVHAADAPNAVEACEVCRPRPTHKFQLLDMPLSP